MVIETMTFRLLPARDEAAFLIADKAVQTEFAYHQRGLVRRTTARGAAGTWIVIDVWHSSADADSCAARWHDDPTAAKFMALVDGGSVQVERYTALD